MRNCCKSSFFEKVIRSTLFIEDCAWNGFRTRLFMAIKVTLVEFIASFFVCEVTQLYGMPAAFVKGDALHDYNKFIIQGK